MKKVFITALAVLFIAFLGNAQPPGGGQMDPEETVKRKTEKMVGDLGLNPEQTKKVEALNRKYGEKSGELFQSSGGNREGMREKMKQIRQEKDAELKTVLTEEQFTKYEELERKRREEFRQRAGDRPPGARSGPPRGQRGQQRGTGNK